MYALNSAQLSKPLEPLTGFRLRHIRELDGIRGLAALLVFFHHAAFVSVRDPAWTGVARVVIDVSGYGYVGVDLFFVLSGFLITSLLLQDRGSAAYYQDFYWKRALRILPLYVVCLVVTLALTRNVGYFLFSLFFAANFVMLAHVASVGVFWSLAIEEQFYLVWPTIVRFRSTEQVRFWALGAALGCFGLRLIFAFFGHFDYLLSFLRCDGLAFGALLACYFSKAETRTNEQRAAATRVLGGLLLLGVVVFGVSSVQAGTSVRTIAMVAAFHQTGIVLVTGSVVGLAILYSGSRSLGVLRSRVLTFFGLISYAFYMCHGYFLALYVRLWGPILANQSGRLWGELVFVGVVSVAVCLVSRYALELPVMSLRKRVLRRPSATAETDDPPLPLANL